jgi:hypothetical protein
MISCKFKTNLWTDDSLVKLFSNINMQDCISSRFLNKGFLSSNPNLECPILYTMYPRSSLRVGGPRLYSRHGELRSFCWPLCADWHLCMFSPRYEKNSIEAEILNERINEKTDEWCVLERAMERSVTRRIPVHKWLCCLSKLIFARGFVWVWNLVSDIKGGTGCWGEYLDRREIKWREVGENCIMRSFITCTFRQV